MPTATSSTVAKAFRVLALFRTRPLLGAAECARLLDMPRASAHRMLVSLAQAGALEATPKGQYRLTLRMFELGQHVPFQRRLFDAAYLPMEALVTKTGLSAHFAVRDGLELVYFVKLRHAPDRTRAHSGQRNSLHATAIGKVLLAHAPDDVVEQLLSQPLHRFTSYTISTPEQLRDQLRRVREEGFAYDREERTVGLVSIATAVYDPRGNGAAANGAGSREAGGGGPAALSLLAPVEKYRQRLETLKHDLAATKRTIEANLARPDD